MDSATRLQSGTWQGECCCAALSFWFALGLQPMGLCMTRMGLPSRLLFHGDSKSRHVDTED